MYGMRTGATRKSRTRLASSRTRVKTAIHVLAPRSARAEGESRGDFPNRYAQAEQQRPKRLYKFQGRVCKVLTLYLDLDSYARLTERAYRERVSRSALASEILRRALGTERRVPVRMRKKNG